jgi:hypothetical protein
VLPSAVQRVIHPTENARYTFVDPILDDQVLACIRQAATNMDAKRDGVGDGVAKDVAD